MQKGKLKIALYGLLAVALAGMLAVAVSQTKDANLQEKVNTFLQKFSQRW